MKKNKTLQPKNIALVITVIIGIGFFYFIYNNSLHSKKTTETNTTPLKKNTIFIPQNNYLTKDFQKQIEKISPPTFPNNICSLTDYKAEKISSQEQIQPIKKNKNLQKIVRKNSLAFAKAIDDCAKKGGGTVQVPAGIWLTGAIHLKSNINLHLNKNATILFSDNPLDFLPAVQTRFIGLDVYTYSPFIYAQNCQNIALTGEGTIDGNGNSETWKHFRHNQKLTIQKLYRLSLKNIPVNKRIFTKKKDYLRPSLIQFYNSNNILVSGLTIKSGPMWTIHPVYSKNIIVENVTVKTENPNNDGLVLDSVQNALINNNIFATQDDAIVLKSGRDQDGWRKNQPTKNIFIKNNTIKKAHAAVAFGSEMSGGIENVFVDNMDIANVTAGFRLKTTLGRGGYIKNILIQNANIIDYNSPVLPLKKAIQIDMNYGSRTIKPKTKKMPQIYNIKFENITVSSNKTFLILLDGLRDNLFNVIFKNISSASKKLNTVIKKSQRLNFFNVSSNNYQIKNSDYITITADCCADIKKDIFSQRIIRHCPDKFIPK